MNLADIREKAQQEKKKSDEQSETAFISQSANLKHDAPPAPAAAGETAAPPAPSVPPAPLVPSVPSVVTTSRVPGPFDPLEVLLQGRSLAGCERNALVDETALEETVVEDFREFLCFRVSDELYAVDIMEIKEIIKPREITEVPRVPSFISGVLSLRGIIIPVFNMHERLGLEGNGAKGKERIIVVKKGEEFTGIVVDEVIQVVRIAEGSIEQPPAVLDGIDRDFVQGVGRFDGKMLILLNLRNILDLSLM